MSEEVILTYHSLSLSYQTSWQLVLTIPDAHLIEDTDSMGWVNSFNLINEDVTCDLNTYVILRHNNLLVMGKRNKSTKRKPIFKSACAEQ